MLPLNCSCLLYTFLTWLLWVEGIIVSEVLTQLPPPPSPLLHCNICIGWNFNFKVHWYSLNLWHLSNCHFQFFSATSFLMWIFLLNFLLVPNMFDHDCDEGYIAKSAVDLVIFLTVFLVHVVKIFSVTSKVYNKLRYQTDNRSGDEKLCCNVSLSP